MAARKNMERWLRNLNILKGYVKEFNRLPTHRDEYEGIKIGYWLNYQRVLLRKGELPEECINALNDSFPFWCGTKEEIERENRILLINSNWKSKIPKGNTPIDTVFYDDRLYNFLNNNIFDIETLLSIEPLVLNTREYYECLSKIIPIIHPRYALLLRHIFGERVIVSLEEMKEFFYSFYISSPEDMEYKMNEMINTLTEMQTKVIKLRFGLYKDMKNLTLEETGRFLKITRERVRQLEITAIRKLRHPHCLSILTRINNDVLEGLDKNTRMYLYHNEINSIEGLIKLAEDGNTSYRLKATLYDFIAKSIEEDQKESTPKDILDRDISILKLSTRSYNSLKRSGYNTVRDIIKLYQDKDTLMMIRNLGKKSRDEIEKKLFELNISY